MVLDGERFRSMSLSAWPDSSFTKSDIGVVQKRIDDSKSSISLR